MAFETTTELAEYVEQEIGHRLASGTASTQRADIVSHLNRGNEIVHGGGGILNFDDQNRRMREDVVFSFAKSKNPKLIELQAPEESLTASITQGTTGVTLSSTIATTRADWFIRIGGDSEVYRISAHTAGTDTLTLDGNYMAATASSESCKIFPLRYTLGSDVLRIISPFRAFSEEEGKSISLVDYEEMIDQYPLAGIDKAFPRLSSIINESSGTFTIQFNSYADSLQRLEVDWIQKPTTLVAGSVNPTMPGRFRLCLGHLAAYFMLRRNRNDIAQGHLEDARDLFASMVDWEQQNFSHNDRNYARIIPNYGVARVNKRLKIEKAYTRS